MAAYDLLLRNARVVDGSGAPSFAGDVAVADGRIAAVSRLDGATAEREVDVAGQVVCPGFVDVHAHSDIPLLVQPRNEPKVRQGITTELMGADGLSYAPLSPARLAEVRRYLAALYGNPADLDWTWSSVADFLARFDRQVADNVFYVVPHQALRLETGGWRSGPATPDELRQMRNLLRQGLAEGARGLGTGLDYFPHGTSSTDELVGLCEVVAEAGGVYVTHVRYHQLGVVDAVRETIEIAQRTGVKVLISHLRNRAPLPLIDEALARGLDIAFDTYPYNAGSSVLLSFLPAWAHEGGPDALIERLREPAVRQRLREELHPRLAGDLGTIRLCYLEAESLRAYEGRSLADVLAERGTDVVETICDLLLETDLAAGWISHGGGTEEDLLACMRHPAHMASTDGILVGGVPHPRAWGTYPRYLGRYVREQGILGLEDCVRRMTSMPASRFDLRDRGLVREGWAADLVVFDPATVEDRATYERPKQHPVGISHVVVNGTLVVDDGRHTGALPGQVLRA